jgi:hypothetical protein
VEDLQKQLNAETIECKCADEKQKVIKTKEHALEAALQNESRRYEILLAEKNQLATLTALRHSNCESMRDRPTKTRGNGPHIVGKISNVCGRQRTTQARLTIMRLPKERISTSRHFEKMLDMRTNSLRTN